MKSYVAKFTLVALIAAPLVAQAENIIAPAGRMDNLSLLPGPKLLSPATATGEVVPGQTWKPKVVAGTLSSRPPTEPRVFLVNGTSNLQLSAPGGLPILSGGFYFRSTSNPPAGRQDSTRRIQLPLKPVDFESLRFDATMPKTVIPPLQKKSETRREEF